MLSGPQIILILKILVTLVTILFCGSLVALARNQRKWHGRINIVFFILTITTVIGFEVILRIGTDVTSQFSEEAKQMLRLHLCFSVPAAFVLPGMLLTGLQRRRAIHIPLGVIFTLLWIGTFITGVFFLPHE